MSDLTFQNGSVSFWILSTKITKEKTGDIVEVWEVPCRQYLDPVRILKSFVESRTVKFGKAEAFPLFLHEDGSISSNLYLLLSLLLRHPNTLRGCVTSCSIVVQCTFPDRKRPGFDSQLGTRCPPYGVVPFPWN